MGLKHRKASLICAFIVFFFDNFGVSIVFPLFGPLILESQYNILSSADPLHTKNILLGTLLSAFPLIQFFSAPIIGDIADQMGRKKAFFITITGTTIGYALTGVGIHLNSYGFMFFSRVLTGFFAGNLSICLATVADLSVDEKRRAKNFAWLSTLGGTGWIIAILIGGYLSNPKIVKFFSPALPFWITAAFSCISLIIVSIYFKETHASKQKEKKLDFVKGLHDIVNSLKIKNLRLLFIVLFFWMLGWVVSIQWYSGFSVERYNASQLQIIWAFVILGIVWALGSSVANRFLINRFPIKYIVLVGLCLLSISQYFSAIEVNFVLFSTFYLISSFFASLCWSNSFNLISIASTKDNQGKTMGLGQSMLSFAQFLGPFLGGILANVGIKTIYFFSASFVMIAFLLLIIWNLSEEKTKKIY